MKVGQATTSPRFLRGTHAIEYIVQGCEKYGAYGIRQVAVANDGQPLCIERHRGFKSKPEDPMPRWVVIRGSGACREGFFGLWLPHLNDLNAECKLVPLKKDDRPVDGRIS